MALQAAWPLIDWPVGTWPLLTWPLLPPQVFAEATEHTVADKIVAEYSVALPAVADGTYSFEFTTIIAGGTWTFLFAFGDDGWAGWATLPTGEVRPFGCVPDVLNWSGFSDWGVVLVSDKTALGIDDLVGSSLFVVEFGG